MHKENSKLKQNLVKSCNRFNKENKTTKFNTPVNNQFLLNRYKTKKDIKFPHGSTQRAFDDLQMSLWIIDTSEVDVVKLQNSLTLLCTITGEAKVDFIVDNAIGSDDESYNYGTPLQDTIA